MDYKVIRWRDATKTSVLAVCSDDSEQIIPVADGNIDWEKIKDGAAHFLLPLVTPFVADSVSARQFKLQLLAANLLDQVNGWIATQPRAVQIAYEYSGTFVRSEPMMAAGFAAMGFTSSQIDDFFEAASGL